MQAEKANEEAQVKIFQEKEMTLQEWEKISQEKEALHMRWLHLMNSLLNNIDNKKNIKL